MLERAPLDELTPRPGASPGLLRRRYSVPETIMRKYRLAQQKSDSEESPPATERGPASTSPPRDACCSPCDMAHRFGRRDRELMRKSALLRRMWGRGCCRCGEPPPGPAQRARETRSLDGSRSELRPLSGGPSAGSATPKRQRPDAARDFRASDEMLRAAMRNSYDRAEESRRGDFSDCCTYRSHRRETSSCVESATDGFTDSECSRTNMFVHYSNGRSSDAATIEIKSSSAADVHVNEPSTTDTSEAYSASFLTTKETKEAERLKFGDETSASAHIDGRISERPASLDNEDINLLPYNKPLTIETPAYEVLEIVVSETLNTSTIPAITTQSPEREPNHKISKAPSFNPKVLQHINIDEYVSHILVESLNSLTDQLECMNASIGSDRKISIVEKEIKVKLQNTGVNTIVHLSPTSNNQIIFGNEELCNRDESKDVCNNPRDVVAIREERALSVESNNNIMSVNTAASPGGAFDIQHDNVNKAVLHQIQKLFHDELQNLDSDKGYSRKIMPEISHIEISNVDVFLDNNSDLTREPINTVRVHATRKSDDCEVIGGVGTCNYYPVVDDNPVVPRFTAFPHTDSMEVNTSSSEDAELVGSDCTSLVDSLDDPNSPRSVLLRRSFSRRSELVRSAIDILDLLPENVQAEHAHPKDKGESFFIRITDDECDCDKENIKVADHMPEKIKQRLYRRHRKRELRMECARRSRVKQLKREAQRQRSDDAHRTKKEVERECMAIVNALINDVIARIAQEEYKCMRIKQRPDKMINSKSYENVSKRNWKKDLEPIENQDAFKNHKTSTVRFESRHTQKERHRGDRHQVHGKLSLLTRPSLTADDRGPKRIYQKSEIREGSKCIEILEILEYVNGSQSSAETATSDENLNHYSKNKKSRIPVPVHEKLQKSPDNPRSDYKKSPPPVRERESNTNRLIADMLLQALADGERAPRPAGLSYRAAPPLVEQRSRSNSLRFKRTFDIIPEERSSLSLESGNEDVNHNRRASAPSLGDEHRETVGCDASPPAAPPPAAPTFFDMAARNSKSTKSASTSPITYDDHDKRSPKSKHQTTMTSPVSKSAATSPLRAAGEGGGGTRRAHVLRSRAGLGVVPRDQGVKEKDGVSPKGERARERNSTSTQCERGADAARPPRRPARAPPAPLTRTTRHRAGAQRDLPFQSTEKRNSRPTSLERSEGETAPPAAPSEYKDNNEGGSSSDSSESNGSLLCSLAPKWLSQARHRRATRRREAAPSAPPEPRPPSSPHSTRQIPGTRMEDVSGAGVGADAGAGGWSVTVAGSCRATLPADVEMRLRFPHEREHASDASWQECACPHCAACACAAPRAVLHQHAHAHAHGHGHARLARADSSKLTLTMKKEALDSSVLASKSTKKSSDPLPDLETYRASRSKVKSSVKTQRGYSLHCWLPGNEPAPIRECNGLTVLGCAIIPELKPRVPTMSERDLTRVYTPRHYLRS